MGKICMIRHLFVRLSEEEGAIRRRKEGTAEKVIWMDFIRFLRPPNDDDDGSVLAIVVAELQDHPFACITRRGRYGVPCK